MITDFFNIEEVMCPHVIAKYRSWTPLNNLGHFAWNFFDIRLLVTVEILRQEIGLPIYANDYAVHGKLSQRGFRCPKCALPKAVFECGALFVDPHSLGKGLDFDVKEMTAEEVRQWIINNQKLLPYPIRLENHVTWVHLDVYNNSSEKVSLFQTYDTQ
jgi:hypothetical protein